MIILDWDALLSLKTPWAHLAVCPERAIDNFVRGKHHHEEQVIVRIIRGRRCATEERLFQEWAAALQFPYYFGHNWDALTDCLRDLEWLPRKLDWSGESSFVFFVTRVNALLAEEERGFRILLDILRQVALEWATPIPPGAEWPRPAVPFRVVFHCEAEDETACRRRLEGAGVELALPPRSSASGVRPHPGAQG